MSSSSPTTKRPHSVSSSHSRTKSISTSPNHNTSKSLEQQQRDSFQRNSQQQQQQNSGESLSQARKRLTEPFNSIDDLKGQSSPVTISATNPLLGADALEKMHHQQQQQSGAISDAGSTYSSRKMQSISQSAIKTAPHTARTNVTALSEGVKSQMAPNDAPPFELTFADIERAHQEQKHSTVISLNRDFFPIQNIFFLVWIVYLVMYLADPLVNFSCFYGNKKKFDTIYAAMNSVWGLKNELVVDVLIYVDSGVQALLAIGLFIVLIVKLFRWIGFMSGRGYFLKDYFPRSWVEISFICALMVYFSVVTLLSNLLVGNRLWMYEMAQYFHSVVFAVVFFFPKGHAFAYYFVPVHWCLYYLSLAIDAIPKVGMDSEVDAFVGYMESLCFQSGLGHGAFYTLKAFYLIFAFLFFVAGSILLFSIVLRRSWFRSIARESILLVFKLAVLFNVILIIFDSLYGERNNVWKDQSTILMIFLCSIMYLHQPEIGQTWNFERKRANQHKIYTHVPDPKGDTMTQEQEEEEMALKSIGTAARDDAMSVYTQPVEDDDDSTDGAFSVHDNVNQDGVPPVRQGGPSPALGAEQDEVNVGDSYSGNMRTSSRRASVGSQKHSRAGSAFGDGEDEEEESFNGRRSEVSVQSH